MAKTVRPSDEVLRNVKVAEDDLGLVEIALKEGWASAEAVAQRCATDLDELQEEYRPLLDTIEAYPREVERRKALLKIAMSTIQKSRQFGRVQVQWVNGSTKWEFDPDEVEKVMQLLGERGIDDLAKRLRDAKRNGGRNGYSRVTILDA